MQISPWVTIHSQTVNRSPINLSSATRLADWLERQRRWLLLGLLLLLHLGLMQGVDSLLGRTMLVAHIGLFILWQPFISAEHRLNYSHFAGIIALVGAAIAWLNWGTLAVGDVHRRHHRRQGFFLRRALEQALHLMALAYLVMVLLIFILPQALPHSQPHQEVFALLTRYGLPLLLLGMAILPHEGEQEQRAEVIDLVYSIFVFLMLAVLVLGSLAFMQVWQLGYVESLLGALATNALLLFLFSWTWNPLAGFSGLGALFSRYLLSIGLPFENWMHALAAHSQRESNPEKFLASTCADLANLLPWVVGGEWQANRKQGEFGMREDKSLSFNHGPLRILLYVRHPISPSLIWHITLLVQIIGEFYQAKFSARQLTQMAYLQAIHETGARITHDVKNLIQSLNMLCLAAGREKQDEVVSPQFQSLLRRQLPVIAQRLQQALDKLQKPVGDQSLPVKAQAWWNENRQRYAEQEISFEATGELEGLELPAELFTSVIENLLQNALDKRRSNPQLKITARLEMTDHEKTGQAILTVCDDGAPLPASVTEELFASPVQSENGYGISLYQAARHAEADGYRLELLSNLPGRVCFRLAPGPA